METRSPNETDRPIPPPPQQPPLLVLYDTRDQPGVLRHHVPEVPARMERALDRLPPPLEDAHDPAFPSLFFACGDEEKNAKRLLEKRFKGVDLGDPKVLRRASAFLARRGYSSEVIFSLMRRRPDDDLEP